MIDQQFPKAYTEKEINEIVAKQLELGITAICREIGMAIETLQKQIQELQVASNAMIEEMKEWKKKNERTLQ